MNDCSFIPLQLWKTNVFQQKTCPAYFFFILSAYTLFHKFRQAKNLGFYFFSVYLMSLMTVERRQNGAHAPETNCAAFKLKYFPFTLSLLFTSIIEHFRIWDNTGYKTHNKRTLWLSRACGLMLYLTAQIGNFVSYLI